MGTAMKHPVPDRVKPSFVILTSGHSDVQSWASECPDVKNYKWRLNSVWHRMLYSCTHMATVGFKGLIQFICVWREGGNGAYNVRRVKHFALKWDCYNTTKSHHFQAIPLYVPWRERPSAWHSPAPLSIILNTPLLYTHKRGAVEVFLDLFISPLRRHPTCHAYWFDRSIFLCKFLRFVIV